MNQNEILANAAEVTAVEVDEVKPKTKDERVEADRKLRAALVDLEPMAGRDGLMRLIEAGTFARSMRGMMQEQFKKPKTKRFHYGEGLKTHFDAKRLEALQAKQAKKQAKLAQV